jgi:uncharacterized protein (TIGR00725 family)
VIPRAPLVAVVGDGTVTDGDPGWRLAEELGERLVEAGMRLLTGGLGGVMEAACRGARRSGAHRPGAIVGLLPGGDAASANPYVDIALPTSLGHLRNALVAQADALVAIGGGAGTLSELALGWLNGRLIIAYRVAGWSGRLAGTAIDPRQRFRSIPDDQVFGVDSADEVLALLRQRLGEYAAARTRLT